MRTGANDEIRTRDLLITNQLLYRLSYIGFYSETASIPIQISSCPLYCPFYKKLANQGDAIHAGSRPAFYLSKSVPLPTVQHLFRTIERGRQAHSQEFGVTTIPPPLRMNTMIPNPPRFVHEFRSEYEVTNPGKKAVEEVRGGHLNPPPVDFSADFFASGFFLIRKNSLKRGNDGVAHLGGPHPAGSFRINIACPIAFSNDGAHGGFDRGCRGRFAQ